MNNTEPDTDSTSSNEPEKFYLPAVTSPPDLERIEKVVSDVFDFHGVVLIPDTYNN